MKKLDVPLKLQNPTSKDCGALCVQMVLEYFGIVKEAQEIIKSLTYYENGTSAFDNGSLLLAEGLSVTAITAQPFLFPPDIVPTLHSKEVLIAHLDEKRVNKNFERYIPTFKEGVTKFKKFLLDGGELRMDIPNFAHIKESIDAGNPVIALLFGLALGTKQGGYHYVVVAGYDDDNVFLLNPLPDSKRESWFPIEQFLFAVHSSTTYDVDNGTFLVISK